MSEKIRCGLHAEIQNAGERIREYVAHLETDAAFTILKRQQAESELAAEKARGERLTAALAAVLDRYLGLVDSGDCGNWEPREEKEVVEAKNALGHT